MFKMKKLTLIIAIFLTFQNCDTTKSLFKTKSIKESAIAETDKTKTKTNQFTAVNLDEFTITLEPVNPKEPSTYTLPNGAEQTSINTKHTFNKRKETTTNNTVKDEVKDVAKKEDIVTKDNSKEKDLERNYSTSVLYIVGGIALIVLILGAIALFLIYKTINKRLDMMQGTIQSITKIV